ncbi:MAG: hypothetical protein PHU06_03770 [Gallionella sp.]|nr:hypothetical protein [Gallionella sp.]MDD4958617.1 hypothetical protein [Gallionella sp.]
MSSKIFHERSIEFQLKIDTAVVLTKTEPTEIDAQLYAKVQKVISQVVKKIAGKTKLKTTFPKPWIREGIRYDTAVPSSNGLFRKHNMSLAIEATDELTKFKCKQHNFIPELLYRKPKSALCYPKNKGTSVKLKLEQDIHFNNCKYCASGSLFLKGRRTDITTVGDFTQLFPKIEQISPSETLLYPVSHWQETVCGKMVTTWGDITLEWDLVNRWDNQTRTLLESELSYKIFKSLKADWDDALLALGNQLYLELRTAGIFRQHPPIFYFHDPVASLELADIVNDS